MRRFRWLPCSPWVSTLISAVHTTQAWSGSSAAPHKRLSRRRYAADNTRGRSTHVKELIDELRKKDKAAAQTFLEGLLPRDRLDVVRTIYHERARRKAHRRPNSLLPKYLSPLFERRYFFKEDDLREESTLGRGPGGQATNRRMQTAIIQHQPSGLVVKFSRFPSLWLNRRAARELLHWRLEEHLLGDRSKLGSMKRLQELRRKRRLRLRRRLTAKGRRAAMTMADDYFASFLSGAAPLPIQATQQLGAPLGGTKIFVSSFFDEQCQHLWRLLETSFKQLNPTSDTADVGTDVLPDFFLFIFPAVEGVASASHPAIQACVHSPPSMDNVRRAFHCFCELFGLRVAAVDTRIVLNRDGLNWIEVRGRRVNPCGGLQPLARASWRRVHQSLHQLGLMEEAKSVRRLFVRESRRPDGGWAADMLAQLPSQKP